MAKVQGIPQTNTVEEKAADKLEHRLTGWPQAPHSMNAAPLASKPVIRLVCATRHDRAAFFTQSLLGQSLKALHRMQRVEICLFANNTQGLSQVYNRVIEQAAENPALLVFVHDDVLLSDFFWAERLRAGLHQFDVIGLAGNRRRVPRQPGWAFVNEQLAWDQKANLSGVIGHGKSFPPGNLSLYGPPGVAVKLLDGVLLATYSQTLHRCGLRFDERFTFHFYDMDFCRTAEILNLRLGTWPLSVVHASGGNYKSAAWNEGYTRYLDKWKS